MIRMSPWLGPLGLRSSALTVLFFSTAMIVGPPGPLLVGLLGVDAEAARTPSATPAPTMSAMIAVASLSLMARILVGSSFVISCCFSCGSLVCMGAIPLSSMRC
jgi:hypothetical protein